MARAGNTNRAVKRLGHDVEKSGAIGRCQWSYIRAQIVVFDRPASLKGVLPTSHPVIGPYQHRSVSACSNVYQYLLCPLYVVCMVSVLDRKGCTHRCVSDSAASEVISQPVIVAPDIVVYAAVGCFALPAQSDSSRNMTLERLSICCVQRRAGGRQPCPAEKQMP